jgi:hypothetical protein
MNDIYPIKDIITPLYPIVLILIIILAILGYKFYLFLKDNPVTSWWGWGGMGGWLGDFWEIIRRLQDDIENLDENIFYRILYYALYLRILRTTDIDIKNYTLDKIEKLKWPENFKNLIKEIYLKKYIKTSEKNIDQRKKYIEKVIDSRKILSEIKKMNEEKAKENKDKNNW